MLISVLRLSYDFTEFLLLIFYKKITDLFRSKHSHMDKFPEDVCTAERLTDGNPDIITDDEFLPKKKESYANIFGSPNDSASQVKKTPGKRGRPSGEFFI